MRGMENKHTPGPWRVEWSDDSGMYYIRADRCTVADAIVVGTYDMDEEDANAALIAAAPDLLEALGQLIAAGIQSYPDAWPRAVNRAIDTINKAKSPPTPAAGRSTAGGEG